MSTSKEQHTITLSGLQSARLLAAFQSLEWDDGIMGISHQRAAEVIEDLAGARPSVGSDPIGANCRCLQDYLDWLCVAEVIPLCAACARLVTEGAGALDHCGREWREADTGEACDDRGPRGC